MSNNNVELTKQNLSIEVNPDNNDVTVQPTQATTEITKNHLIFEIKKEDNEVTVNASQSRPQVSIGNCGVQGPPGAAGEGVPAGGDAGQVLAKVDSTDYNTQWVYPSAVSDPYGFASYWMTLARGFSALPTQIGTTASGEVWEYTYQNGTLYRFIATDLSLDAFYTGWDGTNLTGFVAQKETSIINP